MLDASLFSIRVASMLRNTCRSSIVDWRLSMTSFDRHCLLVLRFRFPPPSPKIRIRLRPPTQAPGDPRASRLPVVPVRVRVTAAARLGRVKLRFSLVGIGNRTRAPPPPPLSRVLAPTPFTSVTQCSHREELNANTTQLLPGQSRSRVARLSDFLQGVLRAER